MRKNIVVLSSVSPQEPSSLSSQGSLLGNFSKSNPFASLPCVSIWTLSFPLGWVWLQQSSPVPKDTHTHSYKLLTTPTHTCTLMIFPEAVQPLLVVYKASLHKLVTWVWTSSVWVHLCQWQIRSWGGLFYLWEKSIGNQLHREEWYNPIKGWQRDAVVTSAAVWTIRYN